MGYRDDSATRAASLERKRTQLESLEREVAWLEGRPSARWRDLFGWKQAAEHQIELAYRPDRDELHRAANEVFGVEGRSREVDGKWTWRADAAPYPRRVELTLEGKSLSVTDESRTVPIHLLLAFAGFLSFPDPESLLIIASAIIVFGGLWRQSNRLARKRPRELRDLERWFASPRVRVDENEANVLSELELEHEVPPITTRQHEAS